VYDASVFQDTAVPCVKDFTLAARTGGARWPRK
jgi:hypothetical protein